MCLKQRKNVVGASILVTLVMEVVPFLNLALDVKLGLGGCCCSSPGSFLRVKVDYLVKAIGSYKRRCVLRASLHLLSPQYSNFIAPIPDVVVLSCFLIIVVPQAVCPHYGVLTVV